jgi:hypothetical protein
MALLPFALSHRKHQEKALLLAMGKSRLLKEDGGGEGDFGLN